MAQLLAAQRQLERVRAWLATRPAGWEPGLAEQRTLSDARLLARKISVLAEAHPLAFMRLWTAHCPGCDREMQWVARGVYRCGGCGIEQSGTDPKAEDCRTSQRAALQELADIATLITGSNRAGKTFLGCLMAVLWLYGAEHWVTQTFLALNGLPADLVPNSGNTIWYSSLSNELNITQQEEYFETLLPKATAEKRQWMQRGAFAEVRLHEPGGGTLKFKADEQGWKKYQGAHVDLIVLDEEHTEQVKQECIARTGEEHGRAGRLVLTMTPTGRTYVYRDFVINQLPGHAWSRIIYRDNPHADTASLDARIDPLPPELRDAKKFGLFGAAGKMIFPGFDRLRHCTASDWRAPRDWLKLGGVDFGYTNPFCYLHVAFHPAGKRAVVTHMHYQAGWRTARHAGPIKEIRRAGGQPEDTICDSEDPQGRLALEDAGIPCSPARKGAGSVKRGIELINEKLAQLGVGEQPWLMVHPRCEELIREMEALTRKKLPDDKDEEGKVVTVGPNHAVDTLRYVLTEWVDSYGWALRVR